MKVVRLIKQFWLVFIIWGIGLFLRCYRQDQLLGFYYDQGRDAKMAIDIITGQNFPAIGPTTGIAGLFLGPFWYYLIVPGYYLGQGNPAFASYFIAFIESLTVPLIYYFVKKYWRHHTAVVASVIWSFSHYLIRSSRWFSNPSPLPFFVLVQMILIYKIFSQKRYSLLPYLAFCLGLSLQLEAASAIFFIPIFGLIFLTNFKITAQIKLFDWLKSIAAFGLLLLPQLAFEIKNNFLISRNFIGFLTGRVNSDTGKSWAIPNLEFIGNRLIAYYQNFFSKLDTNVTFFSLLFVTIFIIGIVYLLIHFRRNLFIKIQLLWLFVPLIFLLFFVGNYGTLYDYYLTGFFPAFVIIFSVIITLFSSRILLTISLFTFFLYFYQGNYIQIKNYLLAGTDGPSHITLGNELQAVDKICQLNHLQPGNFDVYVPPVIAHSYEYLISWRQRQNLCSTFDPNRNQHVYLITEIDPPHPERLTNWLDKYKHDQVIQQISYGGVTVTQLIRIAQ